MVWWIAAYVIVALMGFIGLVKNLEPIDGRAWLTVLLMSIFWPAALVYFILP